MDEFRLQKFYRIKNEFHKWADDVLKTDNGEETMKRYRYVIAKEKEVKEGDYETLDAYYEKFWIWVSCRYKE